MLEEINSKYKIDKLVYDEIKKAIRLEVKNSNEDI